MDFQAYQRAFTGRIRDPGAALPTQVSARRMRVYEHLLFNNIETFLQACFPVCRKILGVRRWTRLVRAYFRDHVSHTPYFRQIPEEFLKYLQDETSTAADLPDFLPELAHYEWVELALDTSDQDRDLPPHDPDGDLLAGRPLVNPVLRVLAYRWPVHRLSPRHRPATPLPESTFLMAHRNRVFKVCFSVINPWTAQLLILLQENPELSGDAALSQLAVETSSAPDAIISHGHRLLDDLRDRDVILGTRL